MRTERRPPTAIACITAASIGAMVLYWTYVGMNGSPVRNAATGQLYDVSVRGGRGHAHHSAYVTWPQLETIFFLGLPALSAVGLWVIRQSWRDRRDR